MLSKNCQCWGRMVLLPVGKGAQSHGEMTDPGLYKTTLLTGVRAPSAHIVRGDQVDGLSLLLCVVITI